MLSVCPRLQTQDQIDPTLLLESTEGQFYEHVEAQKFLAGIKKQSKSIYWEPSLSKIEQHNITDLCKKQV